MNRLFPNLSQFFIISLFWLLYFSQPCSSLPNDYQCTLTEKGRFAVYHQHLHSLFFHSSLSDTYIHMHKHIHMHTESQWSIEKRSILTVFKWVTWDSDSINPAVNTGQLSHSFSGLVRGVCQRACVHVHVCVCKGKSVFICLMVEACCWWLR